MSKITHRIRHCFEICAVLAIFVCVLAGDNVESIAAEQKIAANAKGTETAIAFDGRVAGDDQVVRLLLELDRKVEIRALYMDNPRRLVVDLSNTAFSLSNPKNLAPRGLVEKLRYGTMARGHSRIVISLKSPVKIVEQNLTKTKEGRYRFILDFEVVSDAEFTQQIEDQRNTIGQSGNVATKGDRIKNAHRNSNRLIVVIDPGHGGIDGGAKGANGSIEKEITLAVSKRLAKALKNEGLYDVYLTRKDDHFLSLKDRVSFTIRKQADLFISIHADTLAQKHVRGATVYTLSKEASDELSEKLAENENRADLVAGLSEEKVGDVVVDILADLAARETKRFSVRFARQIVATLGEEIKLINNPHRYAAFGVLKDPNVPSVLLELGYLSNLEDEKLLQSKKWREKLVRHLTQTVKLFFADRQ